MKCYKNSTHDIDIIFDRVCLTNTFQHTLRTVIEAEFGETMSGAHTTRGTAQDVLVLATILIRDNRADSKLHGSGKGVYLSEDLWTNGGNIIEGKVAAFNKQYVIQEGMLRNTTTEDDIDLIDPSQPLYAPSELLDDVEDSNRILLPIVGNDVYSITD
ncbi:hypothetical protein BOTCAL_0130g00020 [Botryotinia calthae]|uniref:Uncharacterized protein n=1 Tax=Botryotinia calthae TaxID=38488 RepID=A0A4Y8D3U9_9HELO|nr:hypothetical protein BOTCAL_0130g00020 [Botryotinia calthae]